MNKINTFSRNILRRIGKSNNYLSSLFGPETVRIYPVGYLCNHACPMCWRSNSVDNEKKKLLIALEKKSLKIEEYQKLINTLPPNVNTIEAVGGGEPLMYKEFNTLVDIIKDANLSGSLITNGVLLQGEISEKLLQRNWEKIRVSFHSGSQKTYKLINGADTYKKVILNLRDIIDKKDKSTQVGCLFVIQKGNYKEILQFARIMEKIGVDFIEYDAIFPYSDLMKLSKEELKETLLQLRKVRKTAKIKTNADDTITGYLTQPNRSQLKISKKNYYQDKICTIPSDSLVVDSQGLVSPCCFLDSSEQETYEMGSFRKQKSLWKIWLNKKYLDLRSGFSNGKFAKTCTKQCYYMLSPK